MAEEEDRHCCQRKSKLCTLTGLLTNFQWDKCHQLLHARPSIYLLHMFNYPLVAAPFAIMLTGLPPIQQHIWGIIADASQTYRTACSKEFWVAQLRALLPSCSLKFYKMSMLSTSDFHKQLRQTAWIPSSARRLHQTCLSVLFNYFALLLVNRNPCFPFSLPHTASVLWIPPPQPTHGSLWTSFTLCWNHFGQKIWR